MNEWLNALTQFGALGIMLAWMSGVLIPKLQKQLDSALASFSTELQREREVHERINSALMDRNQRVMDELLDHFKSQHAGRS